MNQSDARYLLKAPVVWLVPLKPVVDVFVPNKPPAPAVFVVLVPPNRLPDAGVWAPNPPNPPPLVPVFAKNILSTFSHDRSEANVFVFDTL